MGMTLIVVCGIGYLKQDVSIAHPWKELIDGGDNIFIAEGTIKFLLAKLQYCINNIIHGLGCFPYKLQYWDLWIAMIKHKI